MEMHKGIVAKNLDKKDVRDIADGRVYGSKGLGFLYRFFSGIINIISLAAVIYFVLINEHSPFGGIKSAMPPAIQHAEPWIYYLVFALICVSIFANTFLYRVLEHRSKKIIEEWEKTGKLPERSEK